MSDYPDSIYHNGRVYTNTAETGATALAVAGGRITAVGREEDVLRLAGPHTERIDLRGRRVIPGLHDSHIHLIRGGLNYNLELRWDGVPSLADAMAMLKQQVQRTPPGQWVRVVGGWTEFQFADRRLPTLEELNAVAPDTPVFILHLYDRALLNQAALRAVGYTKDTQAPPGCEIERDKAGNPTGLLVARPNALILYATLAKGPKLPFEHQKNSSRHFMRELNRLGITSVIDAGGGFQNYPDDYAVIHELHAEGNLSVRIAYNLFTQRPKHELDDFAGWAKIVKPGQGDDYYRMNGAGEMLVFSAADFEDFLEPRPDLAPTMEADLEPVIRLLAENQWPFRLHATYDESISRCLDVFERVHRDVPIDQLRWFFDHAETISERSIERVKALGGGIAIQDRMAFQGEYFADRYGPGAAADAPPVEAMLAAGIPVGAGTDATRVSSYNPFVSLHWLVTGQTLGGLDTRHGEPRLSREKALELYTTGSAWFCRAEETRGRLAPGMLADFAVLSDDYFSVELSAIKSIESVLTVVDGRIVYGAGDFQSFDPPMPPILPEWSPVAVFGGYGAPGLQCRAQGPHHHHGLTCSHGAPRRKKSHGFGAGWTGCDCWAF